MRSRMNHIARHHLSYGEIFSTFIGLLLGLGLSMGGSACSTGVFAEISPTNSEGILDGDSTGSGLDEETFDHSQDGTSSSASATQTSTTSDSGSSGSSSGMDTDSISPNTATDDTGSDNSDTTESSDNDTSTTSSDSESTDTTSDTEPEDLNLPIGILIPGAFEQPSPNFERCYSFEASAKTEYTLTISVDDGPRNQKIRVEVKSADGETKLKPTEIDIQTALARSFVSDTDSLIRLCLSASQTNAIYKYRLRVDPDLEHGLQQDPLSFEPNNSPASSRIVSAGESVASVLSSDILDYRDCYRILTKTDIEYSLSFAFESNTQGASVYLDLLHADGSTMLKNHRLTMETGLTQSFSTPPNSHTTLCIKTRDYDRTHNYRFRIDEDWEHDLHQDPQTFEPNNTLASAFVLPPGMIFRSALSEDIMDFRDCYRISVENDVTQTLIVAVDPANQSHVIDLEVLADDGTEILETDAIETGSTSIHLFRGNSASDHAVACISTANHQERFDYQIRSDPDWSHNLVQDDITYEPNDSPVTAKELPIGERLTSELSSEQIDTADCYRVMKLETGSQYSLKLQVIEEGTAKQIRCEMFSGADEKPLFPPKNLKPGQEINEPFTMDNNGHATICLYSDAPRDLQKYSIEVSATAI